MIHSVWELSFSGLSDYTLVKFPLFIFPCPFWSRSFSKTSKSLLKSIADQESSFLYLVVSTPGAGGTYSGCHVSRGRGSAQVGNHWSCIWVTKNGRRNSDMFAISDTCLKHWRSLWSTELTSSCWAHCFYKVLADNRYKHLKLIIQSKIRNRHSARNHPNLKDFFLKILQKGVCRYILPLDARGRIESLQHHE